MTHLFPTKQSQRQFSGQKRSSKSSSASLKALTRGARAANSVENKTGPSKFRELRIFR